MLWAFREDLCYQLLPFIWTALQAHILSSDLRLAGWTIGGHRVTVCPYGSQPQSGLSGLSWILPIINKTLLKARTVSRPYIVLLRKGCPPFRDTGKNCWPLATKGQTEAALSRKCPWALPPTVHLSLLGELSVETVS